MTPHTLTLHVSRGELVVPAIEVVVSLGARPIARVPLGLRPLVIGSGEGADVIVGDPRISRRHAEITLTERGLRVLDLDSKNGVFLGAHRVLDALITPTDVVSLADAVTIAFRIAGAPAKIPLSRDVAFGGAIGGSPAMRALFAVLEKAAPTDQTILLAGESGTGKEVLAHAIHERSRFRNGPFVPFDCGAVSPGLVEAELFGYVRGAFTGAATDQQGALARANGGTLFLDELGELPLDMQPKLLRALESRCYQPVGGRGYLPFEARIVAATHRDLASAIRERRFREDLYYRVAVVLVNVPPLRERREDIELLVESFLEQLIPPRALEDLPRGALEMLTRHGWPGNVRELKNTVVRLVLFGDVANAIEGVSVPAGASPFGLTRKVLELTYRDARESIVQSFERWYLEEKLRESGGNVSKTADRIGVSRQLLHRLLAEHGLRGGQR